MFKYFSPALFINFFPNGESCGETANSPQTLVIKRAQDHKIHIYDKVV